MKLSNSQNITIKLNDISIIKFKEIILQNLNRK